MAKASKASAKDRPADTPATTPTSSSTETATATLEAIRIRGARTHNLKNIDVDLPRDQLVVITGVSGSGKSSLAFDTLFAEGQRQYLESLSVYARQFLDQMERPDVDAVDGLEPTICIDQRPGNQNPRSTVATTTEIYDYLRLLMARLGIVACPQCGTLIEQQSPEQMLDQLTALPEGSKLMVLAPLVRGRKGQHAEAYATIRKLGFVRARIDGQVFDLEHLPELDAKKPHSIDAVVDRVVIREGIRSRLSESVRLALKHGDGVMIAQYIEPDMETQLRALPDGDPSQFWRERLFSSQYACPDCKVNLEELEPRTFSFNSPYGACPQCDGIGWKVEFDPDWIIPDASVSVNDGAIVPLKVLKNGSAKDIRQAIDDFIAAAKLDPAAPIASWKLGALEKLFRGDGKKFLGLIPLLEKEYSIAVDDDRRAALESYRGRVVCSSCKGSRLRPEAMGVRFAGKTIHDIVRLSVGEARKFFTGLTFNETDKLVGEPLVTEIARRLEFLEKVGVDYLALDRSADTLSGGELQRVRLATGIGSGLVGVCYVLDEPSIGLHPRDNQRLIDAMRGLQQQGNTVVVVEHDEALMRQADWIIDIGPGAGAEGGRVVAVGTPSEVAANADSLTGHYLAGQSQIELPAQRRRVAKTRSITLEGATANNLKSVSAMFPLGVLCCVTGVSGSGKSSLINETLAPALQRRLGQGGPKPAPHSSLRGASQVDKVVVIDQSPLGRSSRSNAATFMGLFDEVRKVFAGAREAKARGYKANRFSFNVAGGRCEACQGQGVKRIEMNFLPDLTVPCDECGGKRFNPATLAVKYKGLSIADVLNQNVDTALGFFENFPQIHRLLQSLHEVGLGYLPLGQPATALSDGEAQRIKLAEQLARVDTGNTLYLLDEPTTGLHFEDVRRLLAVLQKLVDRGNTVLVIEHHIDVIKSADWLIDLGPDGGSRGGEIVATGTPEEIAAMAGNHTGEALVPVLAKTQ